MTLIPKATVQRRLKNNRNSTTHSHFEVKCTPKTSIANFGLRLLLPCATKLRQGNVLHLSVILFRGRGESASVHAGNCPTGQTPHWADTPPPGRHPPDRQPPQRSVQRTVRILMECILVTLSVLMVLMSFRMLDCEKLDWKPLLNVVKVTICQNMIVDLGTFFNYYALLNLILLKLHKLHNFCFQLLQLAVGCYSHW